MKKKNNKTAVIIASRPLTAGMRRYVPPGAFVIAADAGWRGAEAMGLPVDLAVGDFDSSPPPENAGELLVLPAEKDDTDTHFAAKLALERGYNDIVLLGALGGRPDHHHANKQTMLYLARRGARVLAPDEGCELRCLGPGELVLRRGDWRWLSVFAAGGGAAGVNLQGVRYPLTDAILTCDVPIGVSNEFAGDEARIAFTDGNLFVMLSNGE